MKAFDVCSGELKMNVDCSIIIPAYNAAVTIGGVLECLSKNNIFNFEVIVVDDGSTDDTGGVVRQHQTVDSRIRLITKENGGVSSARNSGLSEATGKWIYFADADDKVNLNDLEKMILAGNDKETDLVVSDYIEEHIQTGVINRISCKLPYDTLLNRDYIEQTIMRRYFIGNNVGLANLWNKIYRKEIIERNKITFDKKRTHGEDWKFNVNYFQVANTVIALDTTVYTYQLDGSQSYQKYGDVGYCLIEGHAITKHLNRQYAFVDATSPEYRNFMGRFLGQSLNYLKVASYSAQDKRLFLRSLEEQELYKYLLKMKPSDLAAIGHSRRSLVAFLMLKLGWFRIGLKILDVKGVK
jgi:glycosyltransferase involved in cell wall biosynthesis